MTAFIPIRLPAVKPHHRPLYAHRTISIIAVVLLLAAFILALLVGISLPIVKSVYILRVYDILTGQPVTSIATELRFGVWGFCASSALDPPTLFTNNGECFGPQLGYDIPASISALVGISSSETNAVLKALLIVLILHLVAAVLSLFTLVASLFLASHTVTIIALLFSVITALLNSVVFAIDIAIVIVVKDELPLFDNGLAVGWGNAPWMTLVAVILTWTAVVVLSARACYCCGVRPHEEESKY